MPISNTINEFIVRLHQYARVIPLAQFQDWALECLKGLIAFDSAMWGTGSDIPAAIHAVHLHRQPREMIETYVAQGFQEIDFLRARALANPGVTINLADLMPRAEFEGTRIHREFAQRFGVEAVLCTVQIEPLSTLSAFISLWRADPAAQFTEDDRRCKQVLMPHLIEAHRANRLWFLQEERVRLLGGNADCGLAICDDHGLLHDANRHFSRLVAAEWPEWSGARLPAALVRCLGAQTFEGKRITIDCTRLADMWLLTVRRVPFAGRLGRREREVAALFARGKGAAEIAQALGLSAATVRNQISRCYKKLGVSNKVELARCLGEIGNAL